jgi:hypothetical protein
MSSQTGVDLIQMAAASGDMSGDAANVVLAIPDIGDQIQKGMGVPVTDVDSTEVLLVTLIVDDTRSIHFGNNVQNIRDGHNKVLDDLKSSKHNKSILIHTVYLSGRVLYEYCKLDQAIYMNDQNYYPDLGFTPLFEQTVVGLGRVQAKWKSFDDAGITCCTATYVITDGDDNARTVSAKQCATVVNDMQSRVESHIIGGIGVGLMDFQGRLAVDFKDVFKSMGMKDLWIRDLVQDKNDPDSGSAWRRAFGTVSQSALLAKQSQSMGTFSQTAAGGFTAS